MLFRFFCSLSSGARTMTCRSPLRVRLPPAVQSALGLAKGAEVEKMVEIFNQEHNTALLSESAASKSGTTASMFKDFGGVIKLVHIGRFVRSFNLSQCPSALPGQELPPKPARSAGQSSAHQMMRPPTPWRWLTPRRS